MKQAVVNLQETMKDLDAYFVANVHDEWQIEAHKDVADKVGELGVAAIEQAGRDFNLKCELTGEYSVGTSWADTH
jgi:DNA polymerase I-like protein with 3'-5' exonuclease and polymerase domains